MESTRVRMILVAVLVCFFAVGMAGLLNYYKYRSTADRIVKERLLVIGNSIEGSIQSSLALGLHLSDIGTLPETMERERATDDLILGIEVFDIDAKPMYGTDRLRATRNMPEAWLAAAQRSGDQGWYVENAGDSAAGLVIKNNFGLKIGYLAVRFSDIKLRQTHDGVARELALGALGIFVLASALASAALLAVMRRLGQDIANVEAVLRSVDPSRLPDAVKAGPFGRALRRFFETVRQTESQLVAVRANLERGSER
jgi:hypothetical protein